MLKDNQSFETEQGRGFNGAAGVQNPSAGVQSAGAGVKARAASELASASRDTNPASSTRQASRAAAALGPQSSELLATAPFSAMHRITQEMDRLFETFGFGR